MPQIFHRSTNTFSKVSIFGAVFFIAFLLWLFGALSRSSWATQADVAREQPENFFDADEDVARRAFAGLHGERRGLVERIREQDFPLGIEPVGLVGQHLELDEAREMFADELLVTGLPEDAGGGIGGGDPARGVQK